MKKHIHEEDDYGWGFQEGTSNGIFAIVISLGHFSYFYERCQK